MDEYSRTLRKWNHREKTLDQVKWTIKREYGRKGFAIRKQTAVARSSYIHTHHVLLPPPDKTKASVTYSKPREPRSTTTVYSPTPCKVPLLLFSPLHAVFGPVGGECGETRLQRPLFLDYDVFLLLLIGSTTTFKYEDDPRLTHGLRQSLKYRLHP